MIFRENKHLSLLMAGAVGIILSAAVGAAQDITKPGVTVRDEVQQRQGQQEQAPSRQGSDLYAMSIADIRAERVLDPQGNAIGDVEEIIVKNDGSDAGLIVRTGAIEGQQGQLVYIPIAAVSLENDGLVLDQQRLVDEAEKADDFNPQDYVAVPETDRALNEFIGEEELTKR